MAFTGMGQILSSRMATRIQQSVNVYNAKIADIQIRIDNLKRFRDRLPSYLSEATANYNRQQEQIAREGVFSL